MIQLPNYVTIMYISQFPYYKNSLVKKMKRKQTCDITKLGYSPTRQTEFRKVTQFNIPNPHPTVSKSYLRLKYLDRQAAALYTGSLRELRTRLT